MTTTDYNKFWSPAFDDMGDFVCFIDCDYNLVKANESFFKVFGGGERDLIGKKCFEVFHCFKNPFPGCPHGKMLDTEVSEKGEFYEPSLKKYLSVTVTPIWSDDHKLIGSIHVAEDVTQLKEEGEKHNRMTKTLGESEEKYRALVECSQAGIGFVDPHENITFVNQAFAEILGYNVDELMGKNLKEFTSAEELEKYYEETSKRMRGEKGRYETFLYHKDGSPRFVSVSAAPLMDSNGNFNGTIGVITDVTEIKRAEDALKELGEKYQTVVENAGDCICLLDTEGRFAHTNKMALVLNEIDDPKQIIGKQLTSMVTPRYREMISRQIKSVLAGETVKFHYETVTPRKRRKWWESTFVPLKDLGGRVTNILQVSRDVTQERESKAKLTFFKEYAENVLANVPISILVVNRSHQIVYANKNFLTKMKMAEAGVIGHKLPEVILPEIMAKTSLQSQISEVMKTRDIIAGQKFEHRGRSFVYHLVPMREAVGKRYNVAIVMEDVTERLALEEQLEHSERLAMMGQFAAGVAHEVNNPLSIVKGNLQYLMEQIKEGADFSKRENVKELKGVIYSAEKEVSRCGDIVDKFLHLAKRSDYKLKANVNVNHVVRHVLHLMERRLSLKKIEVKRDFAPRIAVVHGNHDLLQQVVLNLVLNAEQAITRKGTISIKTWQERQKVYISVKDSGKGIPKELLRYIFNPFFTTKGHEAVGGTGLGLSVAHRIIEDHGGAIGVTSAPKRGSTFTISLPVAKK